MNGRRLALTVYWRLEKLIAPQLKYSQCAYEDVLTPLVQDSTEWLDVGCGHQVLPSWRAQEEKQLVRRCRRVVGLDGDLSSLGKHQTISQLVAGEVEHLPFADGQFDLVTANVVVEHLDDPTSQFREVARVLRPGGVFLFHTPSAWGYSTVATRVLPYGVKRRLAWLLDGRDEGDVFPAYYRANTVRRIERIAPATGFEVQEIRRVPTTALLYMIPPVALLELVWIRLSLTETLKRFRTNLIAILKKRRA